jgi:hypothetical protein
MRLSKFQSEILDAVLKGSIFDIESFFKTFIKSEYSTGKHPSYAIGDDYIISADIPIYVLENEDEAINQTKEFIALWDKLIKNGLIVNVPIHRFPRIVMPVCCKGNEVARRFLTIILPYWHDQIATLSDIYDFIKRGYLTEEEYYHKEEDRDRKKAQRLTLFISLASIVLSLIISIVTTILNYRLYSTERSVTIKNPSAFLDTTKVVIVNNTDAKRNSIIFNKKIK